MYPANLDKITQEYLSGLESYARRARVYLEMDISTWLQSEPHITKVEILLYRGTMGRGSVHITGATSLMDEPVNTQELSKSLHEFLTMLPSHRDTEQLIGLIIDHFLHNVVVYNPIHESKI